MRAQEGREGEVKAQDEREEDANSMHEESHVSNRHMTWWQNAWWVRVNNGPHLRTARNCGKVWRAATRAAQEVRETGKGREREEWEKQETERRESNTLHILLHLQPTLKMKEISIKDELTFCAINVNVYAKESEFDSALVWDPVCAVQARMESFQAVAIENVVLECIGISLSLSTASATILGTNCDLMWNHQREHSLPNIQRPGEARRPCCPNQVPCGRNTPWSWWSCLRCNENHCANELGRRNYVTGETWNDKSPFRLAVNMASV